MLWHIGGFCAGTVISAAFVVQMNDIIYTQLRRHVVQPFQIMKMKDRDNIDMEDLKRIS